MQVGGIAAPSCRSTTSSRVALLLLVVAHRAASDPEAPPDALHDEAKCAGEWTGLRQQLLHWTSSLEEVRAAQAAKVLRSAQDFDYDAERDGGCLLGQVSLRMVKLLHSGAQADAAAEALEPDWHLLNELGWPAVLRSGWPIFQLLDLVRDRLGPGAAGAEAGESGGDAAPAASDCDDPGRPYAGVLERHLRRPPEHAGEGLLESSLAYIASGASEACPLTLAAAFAALAWSRLPVYDAESEALLQEGRRYARRAGSAALLPARGQLLAMLARFALVYQASLQPAPGDLAEPPRGGAAEGARAGAAGGSCVVRIASTPGGRCNFFAPIEQGLAPWRARGIALDDVLRAFRPVMDQKTILFRLLGDDLVVVTPGHSHLDADFGATEPSCLVGALLSVIARVDLPDFDVVLSHGDLPTLRRVADQPPFYGPMDRDARAPAPLFSICTSESFWDILFPNVCRPALVNMSAMSRVPWREKRDAVFWRGTDRGAVNWAARVQDMYEGSPRKRFLDTWGGGQGPFDLAFLEDDLLNATVVNTDPSFVPLDRWPEWRYLLDLPGNGYSGSLKQKLTSSSAVVMVTDVGVPGAQPVYEHYHGGLQDLVHVLRVSVEDAGERVEWARANSEAMRRLVGNANEYMRDFDELTECYIWRLLDEYARLLQYAPTHGQTATLGSDVSVRTVKVQRRPLRSEAAAFRARCLQLLEEHAQ